MEQQGWGWQLCSASAASLWHQQSPCLQLLFILFFFFGSQMLSLERKQETSCTSCLPLSVPINLICVQQEPFPLVHTVQQPGKHSSFYINQSLFNFSLY